MSFLWVTRGRVWGFRFLRNGGFDDPLPIYDAVFSDVGQKPAALIRHRDAVGLRFPDPEGRTDRSGRIIPHDFVLSGELAERIITVQDGIREVWPLVAAEYESVWDQPKAPPAAA